MEKKERRLLRVVIIAFLLLCLIEVRFTTPDILAGTVFQSFLVSAAVSNISTGVLVGIVAAYIFYLLIDFLPRAEKEAKSLLILNLLIASVLDAYERCRFYGHETAITHVNSSVLNDNWLKKTIADVKQRKAHFLPLKLAMQTAHSRLPDFRDTLALTINLSPELALQWLLIIDKVRLLAEEYGQQPQMSAEEIAQVDTDTADHPMRLYKLDLSFRFLEVMEEAQNWLKKIPIKAE